MSLRAKYVQVRGNDGTKEEGNGYRNSINVRLGNSVLALLACCIQA